jgi:RimJ/RimL family protein N-acetyltransferase
LDTAECRLPGAGGPGTVLSAGGRQRRTGERGGLMGVPIRRAGADDRKALTRLLDEGFFQDPVSNWIFPEEEYRRRTHHVLMGAFLDTALEEGYVDMTNDASAVALWLTVPEGEHEEDSDAGPAAFREAIDPGNERIEQIGRITGAAHPAHAPHDYLMLITVSPALTGQGLGTALLTAALDRLDHEGRAAYLEASSLRSRALYERLGFRPTGTRIQLPGGPEMHPLWREPHTS